MAAGKKIRPRTSNSRTAPRTALPQLSKKQSVVSRTAYLAGVAREIFEKEYEPPDLEIFQTLEEHRPARIIRNLCVLRTEIMHRAKPIPAGKPQKARCNLSDYAPAECIVQLQADGISLMTAFYQPWECLIELNRLISDHINNCRDFFPLWIRWEYIKDIFIVPNGLTEAGTQAAAALYQKNRVLYPYQMYIIWQPANEGNILFSDMKFAILLYRWHGDEFTDFSKVSDAGPHTKVNIHSFLEQSRNAVIVVDCENSDPYKLCAALRELDQDTLSRVSKVMLYDDSHSASAWRILSSYIGCPVEHSMIDRVKKQKSLVDISLTAGACREFYQNRVDSFILVSSDSDYWGLISSLPGARFMVMVEREHVSGDLKATMDSAGISYCYLDDFYSGDCGDIQTGALLREIYSYLEKNFQLNTNAMMDYAFRATRVEMSEVERQQFYNKYIKPMRLAIGKDGTVSIRLPEK